MYVDRDASGSSSVIGLLVSPWRPRCAAEISMRSPRPARVVTSTLILGEASSYAGRAGRKDSRRSQSAWPFVARQDDNAAARIRHGALDGSERRGGAGMELPTCLYISARRRGLFAE